MKWMVKTRAEQRPSIDSSQGKSSRRRPPGRPNETETIVIAYLGMFVAQRVPYFSAYAGPDADGASPKAKV